MALHTRPGITGDRLLKTLTAAASALTNVLAGTPLDRFNNYQRWANDQARQLGQLLRPRDLDRLVTTPRYWTLQGLDPAGHGDLGGFVDLEITERRNDLNEAIASLTTDLKRWNARASVQVVLDANVYLHHDTYFDETDWPTILSMPNSDVHIFIPILVVDELDKQKRAAANKKVSDDNPETVRTRARITLRRLEALFTDGSWTAELSRDHTGSENSVSLELVINATHLPRPDPDADLIDQSCDLQDLTGRAVYIVTSDVSMAFRARAAGLRTLSSMANDTSKPIR